MFHGFSGCRNLTGRLTCGQVRNGSWDCPISRRSVRGTCSPAWCPSAQPWVPAKEVAKSSLLNHPENMGFIGDEVTSCWDQSGMLGCLIYFNMKGGWWWMGWIDFDWSESMSGTDMMSGTGMEWMGWNEWGGMNGMDMPRWTAGSQWPRSLLLFGQLRQRVDEVALGAAISACEEGGGSGMIWDDLGRARWVRNV
jgi:hypothetical protein